MPSVTLMNLDAPVQTATGKTLSTGCKWQGDVVGVTYGGTATASTPANGQLLIGDGTGYLVNNLTAANGIRVTNAAGTITLAAGDEQCRLDWVSPTTIRLNRHNGSYLNIATSATSIPLAGVSTTNSGLSANTLYRVYAMLESSTMALRMNTGTSSLDGIGMRVLNSDSTFTLVGMASTNNDTQFIRSSTGNNVISYFNRRPITTVTFLTASVNTAGSTFTELSTSMRMNFVTWSDSEVTIRVMGAKSGSSTNIGYTSIGIDNFTTATHGSGIVQVASFAPFNVTVATLLSEGAHQISPVGHSTGGSTYTWHGVPPVGETMTTYVTVMG